MKVYVGTFRKYNEGSIEGAWIDLDKFANYEEFIAACRKLHADETDPELMIQDVENDGEDWQAGFTGELTSDYKDYWTIKAEIAANAGKLTQPIATVTHNRDKNGIEIKFNERPTADILSDLKAHGWRWSRFAGVWYNRYSENNAAYAEKIAGNAKIAEGSQKKTAPRRPSFIDALEADAKKSIAEYRAWLEADPARVAKLWKHDINGELKDLIAVVRLSTGEWYKIEKSTIETRHCEGEDDGRGRSMADAQAGCAWFKTENGFKLANNCHSVFSPRYNHKYGWNSNGRDERKNWTVHIKEGYATLGLKRDDYNFERDRENCRDLTPEEWRDLRRAYAWRAISKRRRVNAYWRRFGNSKLRTWTYWTEA